MRLDQVKMRKARLPVVGLLLTSAQLLEQACPHLPSLTLLEQALALALGSMSELESMLPPGSMLVLDLILATGSVQAPKPILE